jgi:hypothetical protein
MHFVVLLTVKAGFEKKIQRNEELQQSRKQPRRDNVCWPEQQERVNHIK